jgi:hypothetical protein
MGYCGKHSNLAEQSQCVQSPEECQHIKLLHADTLKQWPKSEPFGRVMSQNMQTITT